MVLKPAPQTPLSAARFAELALEAGLPEGVLNVVQGYGGDEVAGPLTSDPRVDRITFTGSTATGRKVMAAAAQNLTPVSAELGGKSANVVFDDADLEIATDVAIKGVFAGSGQVCLAGTRLLVQRGILDDFLARFTEKAQALTVGDPKADGTRMGPLIEGPHLDKVHGYVELAQAEGGKVVTGGTRLGGDLAGGFYYPPTVITGLTNQARAAREEIFGPVQTVIPFDTEDEALAIAIASPYGLAGILCTQNLDRAHRLAARWQAGMVWINCFFERDLRLPFGGEGQSGVGSEGGPYSREFFTNPRGHPADALTARYSRRGPAPQGPGLWCDCTPTAAYRPRHCCAPAGDLPRGAVVRRDGTSGDRLFLWGEEHRDAPGERLHPRDLVQEWQVGESRCGWSGGRTQEAAASTSGTGGATVNSSLKIILGAMRLRLRAFTAAATMAGGPHRKALMPLQEAKSATTASVTMPVAPSQSCSLSTGR